MQTQMEWRPDPNDIDLLCGCDDSGVLLTLNETTMTLMEMVWSTHQTQKFMVVSILGNNLSKFATDNGDGTWSYHTKHRKTVSVVGK